MDGFNLIWRRQKSAFICVNLWKKSSAAAFGTLEVFSHERHENTRKSVGAIAIDAGRALRAQDILPRDGATLIFVYFRVFRG
jgi:hypothetical protein